MAMDGRFVRDGRGVYSPHLGYDVFWSRYAEVFTEILVLARVKRVDVVDPRWKRADGDRVVFCDLPHFIGPFGLLRNYPSIQRIVRESAVACDAYLLRVPGSIPSIVWRHIRAIRRPFGLEVVGDPWEALAPGNVPAPGRPVFRLLGYWLMKAQCSSASVVCYETKEALQARYPSPGWTTYCSSVELGQDAFASREIMQSRGERFASMPQTWRISFVGSLEQRYKGLHVLLQALSICRSMGLTATLTIVGGGRFLDDMVALSRSLDLQGSTQFVGQVAAGADVRKYLDQCDLFVLPSFTEGLPRALIEAMARGLPCIASSVGGIPELLPPQDMFPPGNPTRLAEKILEVLGDSSRLIQMSRHNLEKAQEYAAPVLRERRTLFLRTLAMAGGKR